MKKFAAFLMILSVSVFTMGCTGGSAKKTGGAKKAPAKTAPAKTAPAKTAPAKTGGSDKK